MSTIHNKTKPRARRVIVTVVAIAALAAPASAFAQGATPTDAEYDTTLTQITAGGNDGNDGTASGTGDPLAQTAASGDTEGTLPFTGLDLAAMALVAGALGVAGFAMRRRVLGNDDTP
jgi:hypothetical protein